ncbi:MAG: DUF86 domain-containing protein [Thermoguttaceae bacterium]|nr:DUF86 domain-containing protein [Thermoguttaceae bacterium]
MLEGHFGSNLPDKEYVGETIFEQIVEHRMLVDAVTSEAVRIGEAVKNIPDSIPERYPDVPRSGMAKLRDVLVH